MSVSSRRPSPSRGRWRPACLAGAAEYLDLFYGRLLPATAEHRSSMLQDLEKGSPPRRRHLREICRRGDARGVDVALNRLLAIWSRRDRRPMPPQGRLHGCARPDHDDRGDDRGCLAARLRPMLARPIPTSAAGFVEVAGGAQTVSPCATYRTRCTPRRRALSAHGGVAYTPHRRRLQTRSRAVGATGNRLVAFYHSHPDHEAYFSDEDLAQRPPSASRRIPLRSRSWSRYAAAR